MNTHLLQKGIKELGLSISGEQLNNFSLFYDEIKKWGIKINITSLLDNEEKLIEELFIDSLSPLLFIKNLKRESNQLLDIGSGGGFPGLPIKIIEPSLCVTLTDSIEKKIFFIKNVIRKLQLKSASAICMRYGDESISLLKPLSFDWATSKAVTEIDQLASWSHPYLKKGGYLICLKTPSTPLSAPTGFEKPEEICYRLPFSHIERKLILYKKS